MSDFINLDPRCSESAKGDSCFYLLNCFNFRAAFGSVLVLYSPPTYYSCSPLPAPCYSHLPLSRLIWSHFSPSVLISFQNFQPVVLHLTNPSFRLHVNSLVSEHQTHTNRCHLLCNFLTTSTQSKAASKKAPLIEES